MWFLGPQSLWQTGSGGGGGPTANIISPAISWGYRKEWLREQGPSVGWVILFFIYYLGVK